MNLETYSPSGVDTTLETLLEGVRKTIVGALSDTCLKTLSSELGGMLAGGKLLRSRMGLRVGLATGASQRSMVRWMAATELIHAASILHDDVIDGGAMRRGAPSFWRSKGTSGAILVGDLLTCSAMKLISSTEDGRLTDDFVAAVTDICNAETEQELMLRNTKSGWEKSVDIARRKTGALFAFAALAGAGTDKRLKDALRESGYVAGTAYQLSDDVLDAFGDQTSCDKTLGTDILHAKPTAATTWREEGISPLHYIGDLCDASERQLAAWPAVQEAWHRYLTTEFRPAISKFTECFSASATT